MLSNDKINLRALEPTDLDLLFRWENDESLWSVGSTIAPFSRKQLWDYIENYDNDIFVARQLRFIIENNSNKVAVGMIDLYDFDPINNRAFVGILIDSLWGHKGYGTEALNLLTDYVKRVLDLHQLVAYIPVDNVYSIDLFAKCGYEKTATLYSWIRIDSEYKDVNVFQKVLHK